MHPTGMSKLASPVTAKDHTQGPASAPVTLVEYGDYQCPSCGEAFIIVERLQKHFGDKLRFVFRNFPLPMHPYAEHAAETVEFAAAHDKFWEMHDLLYKHQRNLADASLLKLATELKLSTDDLTEALEAGTYSDRVQTDMESGEKSGVTGTPMFYINGQLYDEDYDYDTLLAAIESQTK
jgi:protein-disulfide isomerase